MKPDVAKLLHRLWLTSIAVAVVGFALALLWITSSRGPGFDWVWCIAAFGAAAIVYNLALFALCSIFVPNLSAMVEDDTEVHGDDVVHVVRHAETGDDALDPYIRAYATARGASAVAIVAGIVIAIALTFF